MRYAVIQDGIVVNVLWVKPENAKDNWVQLEDGMCVGIGDTYADGRFYHNGEPILTHVERLERTVAELDEALLNAEFALLAGGEL